MSEENYHRLEFRIIERADSKEPVGYFAQSPTLGSSGVRAFHYELAPGISWLEVTPYVIRSYGMPARSIAEGKIVPVPLIAFCWAQSIPLMMYWENQVIIGGQPYAWYLRVPDVAGFLNHIKPVLEKRLANSIACGHSGEYLLGMFPKGVRLILGNGRIDRRTMEARTSGPRQCRFSHA